MRKNVKRQPKKSENWFQIDAGKSKIKANQRATLKH